MTQFKNPNDENLSIRDHQDPDKHWIGETLPAPTQSEIAATVGTTAGPGDSPFPARADHTHKVDVVLASQAGDIKASIAVSCVGWLNLNGATITGGSTLYPDLWAVIPASWKSGANIVLPNMSNRVLEGGGTLGAVGGSMVHTLDLSTLPGHTHVMTHTHGVGFTDNPGDHIHNLQIQQSTTLAAVVRPAASSSTGVTATATAAPVLDPAGAHTHVVTTPGFTGSTQSTGTGSAVSHEPAQLRVNFFVKT